MRGPSFLGVSVSGRRRCVKGALGVAGGRFVPLDPATAPQGFGACEEGQDMPEPDERSGSLSPRRSNTPLLAR